MQLKQFIFIVLILVSNQVFSQIGCRIPGTNTIYPTSTTYLLGVVRVNGVAIGLPATIYHSDSPSISTNISCTIPYLSSAVPLSPAPCYYGTTSGVLNVLVTCSDCAVGERVQYTTSIECNLDDYTWTLGAAAGLFGVLFIRRRNKL